MKLLQDNTVAIQLTTLQQILRWRQDLSLLHARLRPHFARPEPFARALRFLAAILSTTERKNGWQIAEQAHEATPYGMQRLLSGAVWDADGVRDEVRSLALHHLGSQHVTIAIDETSFLKRGHHSAGVGIQHYGLTGDQRNCQVGVFLSLVTPLGHCLIDRELYLPAAWTNDPDRCAQAAIPASHPFQSKPLLAQLMLQRLQHTEVSIAWVVADTVYGSNPGLRSWLQEQQQPYVMAVSCKQSIILQVPGLGLRRLLTAEIPALLSPSDWHTHALSDGTKGPRLFCWASLPIYHLGSDNGWHRLLLRRSLDPTPKLAFFLVFAPAATSLSEIVTALGGRWRIEEDFENGKDLGLDHYEVRSFLGWYRHITLVLLALAFLSTTCLLARVPDEELAALSVPEVRRLLAQILFPAPSACGFVLAWSLWRRIHQHLARVLHTRRRLKAG